MNTIDGFQQCLYHLKMIFLSSECFDEKIIELIEVLESDLVGCLKISDTLQVISNPNKVGLVEGVHEIFNRLLNQIYVSTEGLDDQENFEYHPKT